MDESGERVSNWAPVINDATVTRDLSRSFPVTSATRRPHPFPMPPKEKAAANAGVATESQQSVTSDGIYSYELPRSLVAKIARASVRGSDPLSSWMTNTRRFQIAANFRRKPFSRS